MNNVLEGSLFVNPNKKFDEIQSIIRQFSAEYQQYVGVQEPWRLSDGAHYLW